MTDRQEKMTKNIQTLFPQTQEGKCAVCKDEITDSRKRRYCSDRCKDAAYSTQKLFMWKSVRTRILDEREHVCNRCGFDPEEAEEKRERISQEIQEEYDLVEYVRLERPPSLEVDHIKPVSKGGDVFDEDNLQILCETCNQKKGTKWSGDKTLLDFYELKREGIIGDGD